MWSARQTHIAQCGGARAPLHSVGPRSTPTPHTCRATTSSRTTGASALAKHLLEGKAKDPMSRNAFQVEDEWRGDSPRGSPDAPSPQLGMLLRVPPHALRNLRPLGKVQSAARTRAALLITDPKAGPPAAERSRCQRRPRRLQKTQDAADETGLPIIQQTDDVQMCNPKCACMHQRSLHAIAQHTHNECQPRSVNLCAATFGGNRGRHPRSHDIAAASNSLAMARVHRYRFTSPPRTSCMAAADESQRTPEFNHFWAGMECETPPPSLWPRPCR